MGITLQAELARDYPGHKLTLCPMEENGQRCDWNRGLAHAHNWNTHQRHSLIADNRIEDFAGPAMLLCDLQDAMVRDNRIVLPSPLARPGVKPEALFLRNTADVIEKNNSVVATPP